MSSSKEPYPADKPPLWNYTYHLPDPMDLIVIFQGLLSFSYVTRDAEGNQLPVSDYHCEVGVFNQDAEHRLRIDISGGDCGPEYQYNADDLWNLAADTFLLDIEQKADSVAFYEKRGNFNRASATADPQDFRWLLDAETPDLYNDETRYKKAYYGPKLLVKNGTFFTLCKTNSTFKWVNRTDPGDVLPLGSVALYTAAAMTLDQNKKARFVFKDPGGRLRVCTFGPGRQSADRPAIIAFTDLCYDSVGKPHAINDFYHHFESFSPPLERSPYDLMLDQKGSQHCASPYLPEGKVSPRGSDDAPCHGMGYGRSAHGTP